MQTFKQGDKVRLSEAIEDSRVFTVESCKGVFGNEYVQLEESQWVYHVTELEPVGGVE